MSVRIVHQMLVELGACRGARKRFRSKYPNGTRVSALVLSTWMFERKSQQRAGDYAWMIYNLLSERQYIAFRKRAASCMGILSLEVPQPELRASLAELDTTHLLTKFARKFPERAAEGLEQAVALWKKRKRAKDKHA